MDDTEIKLTLLRDEMAQLQEGIRACSASMQTVRGWSVTVGLASGGFAVTAESGSLALLGIAATASFWALDAHQRSLQQRFVARAREIEVALAGSPIADALARLRVPGIISAATDSSDTDRLLGVLQSALRPGVFTLYLCLIILLALAFIAG